MGKGAGGCFSSGPAVESRAPARVPTPQQTKPAARPTAASAMPTKVYIVFYSTWGHVHSMAKAVKEGVDSVEGCEGVLYQVAETLPAEVLAKMHAPPKPDVPVITADELKNADGVLFGLSTRFGQAAAQMKSFMDSTGGLWQAGALAGKPAGVFFSTGTQGGGQETAAFTFLTHLAHHGMIFVPTGYTFGGDMFNMQEVHGGSPYGAGCFAGPDGSRQPSATELKYAKHQGAYMAGKVKLLAGK